MKNWDAEKLRYKLAAPFAGCMVYALQKSMCEGKTAHYLCASCFQKGQPSILQSVEGGRKGGAFHSSFACSVCKTEAFTGYANAIAPEYFEDIKPMK